MSLLTNPLSDPHSLESRKALVSREVRLEAAQNYATLCDIQKRGIAFVWSNPRSLTPQQVCDALGFDALATFRMHGALTNAIVGIAALDGVAPDILLPTFAFTPHNDGTITVLDTPYVP